MAHNLFEQLVGSWEGTKSLWLAPGEPVRQSASQAQVGESINGQYLEVSYQWEADGEAQNGRLFVGKLQEDGSLKAVWFDSWHMRDSYMALSGEVRDDGVVYLRGSFPAPPGPDWGWEIGLEPQAADSWRFFMVVVTPDGQSMEAVDIPYRRVE